MRVFAAVPSCYPGVMGLMASRGYAIFDTAVGRCGIAWGDGGIAGVQLPEAREIDTRRRMLRHHPDAREFRPPVNAEIAIEAIAALLRGQACDFSDVVLDMHGVPPFNRRVYEFARSIPRGETMTFAAVAKRLGASGAAHAVGQAIGRNPFAVLVPCHRLLPAEGEADGFSMNGGVISKRRLLSLEGARTRSGPTLFDVLLKVAPPRPHS
jgi:methylated-DNA-[protein]-cysteine S-methyltransferase